MSTVIFGLGSNSGDRSKYLQEAIRLVPLENARLSSVYESQALLLEGSPPEWNVPYLNMAVKGETALLPEALLDAVKQIEQQLGRQDRGRWGPREIDIDILCYNEENYQSDRLTIPHIGLTDRAFALVPFAELWPGWQHPLINQSAEALVKQCDTSGITCIPGSLAS